MRRWRLTLVTVVWLAAQMAAFTAPMVAACTDHDHGAVSDGHPCCDGMAPGAICPMHQHAAGAATAASPADDTTGMRCVCHVSDQALASLLSHGILPPDFVLPFTLETATVKVPDVGRSTHAAYPDTPPPQA